MFRPQYPTQHGQHGQPGYRRPLPFFLCDLNTAGKPLPLDAVLPEQFSRPQNGADIRGGEAALMRAVLDDALTCFQKQFVTQGRRAQRLATEAEEWFFSDDPHWPFSFVNICAVLGLDPEYLRQGLAQWHQHPPTTAPPKRQRATLVQQALKIAA